VGFEAVVAVGADEAIFFCKLAQIGRVEEAWSLPVLSVVIKRAVLVIVLGIDRASLGLKIIKV